MEKKTEFALPGQFVRSTEDERYLITKKESSKTLLHFFFLKFLLQKQNKRVNKRPEATAEGPQHVASVSKFMFYEFM